MNNNPPPHLAVRAFIQDNEGKILILKRAVNDAYGDLWCLPGGKVDYGQTAEEAIVREIQEETALECTSALFQFTMDWIPFEPDDKHYHTLFFKCQVRGDLSINGESSDFEWIRVEAIKNYCFAFGNDIAIRNYLDS